MIIKALIGDREIEIQLRRGDHMPTLSIAGRQPDLDLAAVSDYSWSLLMDGQSHYLSIRPSREGYQVLLREQTYQVRLQSETELTMEKLGIRSGAVADAGTVRATIPGLIAAIQVSEGDPIEVGETLLVLEAMKMENELPAPLSGVVEKILVTSGEIVEKGTVLVVISAAGED